MEDKSDQFLKAYQKIKFEEDSSDCFSLASAKRKTLALNFYGSIQLNESNEVTDFLLREDLDEYAKIVDNKDKDKVNNYSDYVLALLSNYQNDDRKNWKSHLDEFNIQEHLKPLPCSGDINCKNSKFTSEDSKLLKSALSQYKKECDTKIPEQPGTRFNPTPLQRNNSIENTSLPGPRNLRQLDTPNEKSETNSKPITNFFRTAREELKIQSVKKHERNGNSNLNYGAVKKTLGTRKGGVFGKFQPPIRSKETQEDELSSSNSMEVDEPVDERLKNIDPAMIELIKNEIMDCGSKIGWDDIAGLHLAKNTIQEIVVWPMLRPDIFTGLRRPPKGILLFGPPGTGKTLIGKCIASQSNSTFFSISASSLTSKWVGDGEKMVRTLFAVAKVHQPSVVFIDEIDSLLSQRSDSEHECSRRIKTEFLVQLDGAGTGDEDRILIIGATNRPQELDEAARRRLVKRLYIPLPDEEARKQIIENLISTERHCLTKSEIEGIAKLTKGYSGADVKNLCQEASLGPIRSITPSMIQCINPEDVRPLNAKDFESALCRIKSSVSESDLDIYVDWDKKYGCGSAIHQLA